MADFPNPKATRRSIPDWILVLARTTLRSSSMRMRLTEADLRFLVETVATERRDHDHIIELVRDKEDFLEQMLEDPRLVERLKKQDEALVRVSPYMLFSVLMREVRRVLQQRGYVYEPEARGKSIAIFEAPAVVELLSVPEAQEYLVEMLYSFVKTDSGVVYWKERGAWHRRRFNDSDMDDMIALAGMVDPELKPRYYQRIADIALFLSGIFPEQAVRVVARTRSTVTAHRTLQDYEREGKQFYGLAAREVSGQALRHTLEVLAEKFTLARAALNELSKRLLATTREHYFGSAFEPS